MKFQKPVLTLKFLVVLLILTGLTSCFTTTSTNNSSVNVTEIASISEEYGLKNISWSPDSTKFVTSAIGGGQIWQLDLDDANEENGYSIENIGALTTQTEQIIDNLSWANDDSIIIGGSVDGVWLWDPQTGTDIKELEHEYGARSFTWSPDGMFLASSSNDGKVRIWDIADDWQLSYVLVSIPDTIREVAWSPNGKWIAATVRNEAWLWNAETGELIRPLKGHSDLVGHIEWSPDSERLATTSDDKTVIIWDVDTGSEQLKLKHDYYVSDVAWSPNGTILASADSNGLIHLWDPNTGDELAVFEGHSDSVTDLDWTNDGRMLASASLFEGAAKIWQIELVDTN